MSAPLDDLTDTQRDAVVHRGSPMLVVGGAGTGKTHVLVRRLVWLVDEGICPPEAVLVLARDAAAADVLRGAVELALGDRAYEELCVHSVRGLCRRLLSDEALAVGVDPFAVPVTPADRLAMLVERIDELDLRSHDFRGRPAGLLAGLIRRIDRLKAELIDADQYGRWALELTEGVQWTTEAIEREREFGRVFAAHDRMLVERGALDDGDVLLLGARLLSGSPLTGQRCGRRWPQLLADDWQELSYGERRVVSLLERAGATLTAAGDDDQALGRLRGDGAGNLLGFAHERPGASVVRLARSFRCPQRVLDAAQAVVAPNEPRLGKDLRGESGGEVRFWRAANERSQAQNIAAELERLIGRAGVAPERLAVLVRGVADEAQSVAVALAERAVPYRVVGSGSFFARAEVRDVLAWLRLLVDPRDAGAVVRALARPPIELNSIDIARCLQISRRRKLDMVAALVAATESPQLPPEGRERILGFLRLHRSAAAALDSTRPDLFVHRLIDRLGLRRQHLFTASPEVVDRLVNLARLGELAADHVRQVPQSTPREFARYIAAVAEARLGEDWPASAVRPGAVAVGSMAALRGAEFDHVFVVGLHSARMPGARIEAVEPIADELLHEQLPSESRAVHAATMRRLLYVAMTRARRSVVLSYATSSQRAARQQASPFVEEARLAVGGEWEDREEELFGPAEALHATFQGLQAELLDSVGRIGSRLGELRLDTELDISHGAVRYLELVKLAALIQRPEGQPVAEALADLNARVGAAATPLQREILESSPLDELVLGAERDERSRAAASAARAEPSLEPFLPRRGDGLVLSASDVETYRTCPLKYKFARVLRIPQDPTLNQRFGILIHQVLERFHATGTVGGRDQLLGLLEAGWRRGGFSDSDEEQQLREKARAALGRYHERLAEDSPTPRWFERSFAFRLGPHHIRGRVDRVDELPGGGFELIDYKTGVPKTASQLRDDVQLALYAVAAREAWDVEATARSYYYVLDDRKVPVPGGDGSVAWIADTVLEVGAGIMGQGFEPTPSYAACSACDYRIACPAAET